MLRRPETQMVLEVSLSPADVMNRLDSSMFRVKHFLLSPALGTDAAFVGQLGESAIKMRVRHGYSNGLTRLLYGQVTPTPSGSRLDLRFRTLWWVVAALRASWLLALLPVGLYLIDVGRLVSPHTSVDWSLAGALLGGPLVTLGLLIAIEVMARRWGDRDEEQMRDHIGRLFADTRTSG
ncbi:MAG TPA: hypothetical protein VGC53_18500 [Vicinamibacteria bacterium]|jgi:hypothetical protein